MTDTTPETPDLYDPTDHSVGEVQAHLDGVSADERARILDVERAGKARKTILDYDPAPAEDPDGYTRVVVSSPTMDDGVERVPAPAPDTPEGDAGA